MTERAWKAPVNWPLWIGLALLLLILVLAWLGPQLASHDPVKPVYIVQNPQTLAFVKPPFRPGQMSGYPLGADPLGRDTLSQLLWALRPTLILVLVAATVRLLLGLLLGVSSGWGAGRITRLLEGATTIAVSVPVLLVALCLVAAFGPQWGVWAFILGLCLTGWAEAARVLHDRTSLIKTQPYIEAAHALGASGTGAVFKHVLPHVLPMVWILLPLEISTALLVTAGLGFLGYFVNAIWIPLGDWTVVRTAGQPELGQMLASGAAIAQRHPWLLLTTGAVVFLLVLTFNLLGEGLRRQADPTRARRRKGRLGAAVERASSSFNEIALERLAMGRGGLTTALGVGALLLLVVGSIAALLRATAIPSAASAVAVPGGHLWAAGRHDAQGTYWASTEGPRQPQVAWTLADESGWAGGPVVATDGTIYVTAKDGRLVAVNPRGAVLWTARLPGQPFGAPALSAEGYIYVLDSEAVLYVLDSQANLVGAVRADPGATPLSSPVVDANGVAYFATERSLLAVRPNGELVWRVGLPTYSYVSPQPLLSPDGRYVFFEDIVLDAATGRTLIEASDAILDRYLVGADGRLYLAGQDNFAAAIIDGEEVQLQPQGQIDLLNLALGQRVPSAAGVAPSGRYWVFYGSPFDFAKLLWTEADGSTLNVVDYPWSGGTGRLVGLGEDGTVYACGSNGRSQRGGILECSGYLVDRPSATWTLEIEPGGAPEGGALVDGRLYVVSGSTLYAIDDGTRIDAK
ncbi:MAG TPA: PQQ-binding-like beta-propeller repeat protein [Anaerolineae bacterium]|nr:PQQ-binding-like beta-propeller repeat protein [Anaerolineae bacterium]